VGLFAVTPGRWLTDLPSAYLLKSYPSNRSDWSGQPSFSIRAGRPGRATWSKVR